MMIGWVCQQRSLNSELRSLSARARLLGRAHAGLLIDGPVVLIVLVLSFEIGAPQCDTSQWAAQTQNGKQCIIRDQWGPTPLSASLMGHHASYSIRSGDGMRYRTTTTSAFAEIMTDF